MPSHLLWLYPYFRLTGMNSWPHEQNFHSAKNPGQGPGFLAALGKTELESGGHKGQHCAGCAFTMAGRSIEIQFHSKKGTAGSTG